MPTENVPVPITLAARRSSAAAARRNTDHHRTAEPDDGIGVFGDGTVGEVTDDCHNRQSGRPPLT
jgi:hypothetical protein